MRYLLANWKMHTTVDQALALVRAIQQGLRERAAAGQRLPRVIVCPPFVSLVPVRAVVDERLVRLGAQNCHWDNEGPHTGEISPVMLTGLAQYVLVGHSERRAVGESDEQISTKVAAVAAAGLTPVLFVGEDEPGAGARAQTEHRLRQGTSRIDLGQQAVLVVYEPAWAIGADRAAGAEYVQEMAAGLKDVLHRLGAHNPEVLYGGTVSKDNIEQFARLDVLDGVGATRASLNAPGFLAMIDRMAGSGGPSRRHQPASRGDIC